MAQLDDGTRTIVGLDTTDLREVDVELDIRWEDESEFVRSELIETIEEIADTPPTEPGVLVHQPYLRGGIGAYTIEGKADLLRLTPTADGVYLELYEVKSASQQKVHHRYQATIYAVLLEDMLQEAEIDYGGDDGQLPVKIITPENDLSDGPEAAEGFNTSPYRAKLQLKLQQGGSFDQTILHTSFEDTTNRIARRCSGCEYEPLCMTRGVENNGLELLGLQAGTQESLHRLGIHTLEDFANLYEHPEEGGDHTDFSRVEPRDEALVQRVRQEADVTNLQKRSQIAYRFLCEINDDYGRDGPDFFPHKLQGTGYKLPEDEHGVYDVDWDRERGPDYPSGSLVRVYLYVQQDFAQARVTLLSGYLENTLTGLSRQVIELPQSLPNTTHEKDSEEDRLFGTFFESFAEAIMEVAPDWESEEFGNDVDLDLDADDGFLHLYLYSDQQRQALMDAIRRHPGARWRRPLRTLLGLRAGIDQEMVSILQDDFRERWALRFPGLGAVQSLAQFKPYQEQWFDWRVQRESGETANLAQIFDTDLFDSVVRYRKSDERLRLDHNSPELAWTEGDQRLARWVYPIRNRETDQIPIEYIWGVLDRLAPEQADDSGRVEQYLYRDELGETEITEEDLELLGNRFSRASHHIERSIWNKSRYVNKEPIDFSELADFSFAPRSIDEACVEYQQLEYHTVKTGLEAYYCQPLEERIDSGNSIVFECTTVDEDQGIIEGSLLKSDLEPYDPTEDIGIIGGPISVTAGDFMVMTKLNEGGERPEDVYNGNPQNIAHSPTIIVSDVAEATGTVSISAPFRDGWPSGNEAYTNWHNGWGTGEEAREDDYSIVVENGDRFVVDPMIDKVTQSRAYEALENAVDAPVRRWLRQLYRGDRQRITIDPWTEEPVEEYLNQMGRADGFARPNQQQEDLVTDLDHGIVMLQGPPGTGKTRYTVAPAVLGRVHAAMNADDGLLGAVSAVSHDAVNEALRSSLDLYDACPPSEGQTDLEFVRICSGSGQGIGDPRVREVHYNDERDVNEIRNLYEEYFADDAPENKRALFFAPPVSIRSFINKMIREIDDIEVDNVVELMQTGGSTIFDLAVIDEASMMDLPLCFLLGSFVGENGQLMLVGDHRQMQPIQQHEWEDEDREPIERHTPFLSALDFLRYLRGEDVEIEYLEADQPELDDPDDALPVHRLRHTYRLPPESARMHTDLFYRKDDIELESAGENPELPAVGSPMNAILDSSDRITLLVHDENQSQKSNPVEQALITELLAPLPIDESTDGDDDLSAGVVVPFRAQRRDVIGVVPRSVLVNTVERFQGGERDMMILSMTASDRGYISQISEFLLDPNRFNVGASRMKRKLVVIASSAIFEESSDDIDLFERQEAWISFFEQMGGLEGDFEAYSISELISDPTSERFLSDIEGMEQTTVRVYSGYDGDI